MTLSFDLYGFKIILVLQFVTILLAHIILCDCVTPYVIVGCVSLRGGLWL